MVCSASWRLTDPLPSLLDVESVVSSVPGITGGAFRPKKLVMLEFSELLRLRWVSLAMLALSVKFTVTVRMSPI